MIKITKKKFYTARNDRIFKAILCNEEKKELMQEFLSRIIERKVDRIIFLNNEQPVETTIERTKTVDFLAKIDKEYIHIELNATNPFFLHNRNFIFFSSIFNRKTKRGEQYDIKTKYLHIDFTYGLSKKGLDKYEYYVMTKNGKKYLENFKIIEFNMDKIMEYWYHNNIHKVNRYKHLIMLDLKKNDLDKISEGDEFIMKFNDEITELNEKETYESAISYEEDQKLILNTIKNRAYDNGVTSGFNQGISQGFNQGKNSKQLEIAQNMLRNGIDLSMIAKCTDLSLSDIKRLNV